MMADKNTNAGQSSCVSTGPGSNQNQNTQSSNA